MLSVVKVCSQNIFGEFLTYSVALKSNTATSDAVHLLLTMLPNFCLSCVHKQFPFVTERNIYLYWNICGFDKVLHTLYR